MGINSLLNQAGTVYNRSGFDRHGNPLLGSGVPVRCRFEQSSKTILNPDGESEPIDGIVFVASDTSISLGDKFVYATQAYRVMRKSPMVDGRGKVRHIELMLQLWRM